MTKPCAPLAARLSIAAKVFSPSGTPILISANPYCAAALSAPFHSYWNHGSSGCFTRKPTLIFAGAAGLAAESADFLPQAARKASEAQRRKVNGRGSFMGEGDTFAGGACLQAIRRTQTVNAS